MLAIVVALALGAPAPLHLADLLREAHEKAGASDAPAAARLQALSNRLVTGRGAYPQPMLIDQLANVARMVGLADQKIGRDAYLRFDDLVRELRALEAEAGTALAPP